MRNKKKILTAAISGCMALMLFGECVFGDVHYFQDGSDGNLYGNGSENITTDTGSNPSSYGSSGTKKNSAYNGYVEPPPQEYLDAAGAKSAMTSMFADIIDSTPSSSNGVWNGDDFLTMTAANWSADMLANMQEQVAIYDQNYQALVDMGNQTSRVNALDNWKTIPVIFEDNGLMDGLYYESGINGNRYDYAYERNESEQTKTGMYQEGDYIDRSLFYSKTFWASLVNLLQGTAAQWPTYDENLETIMDGFSADAATDLNWWHNIINDAGYALYGGGEENNFAVVFNNNPAGYTPSGDVSTMVNWVQGGVDYNKAFSSQIDGFRSSSMADFSTYYVMDDYHVDTISEGEIETLEETDGRYWYIINRDTGEVVMADLYTDNVQHQLIVDDTYLDEGRYITIPLRETRYRLKRTLTYTRTRYLISNGRVLWSKTVTSGGLITLVNEEFEGPLVEGNAENFSVYGEQDESDVSHVLQRID